MLISIIIKLTINLIYDIYYYSNFSLGLRFKSDKSISARRVYKSKKIYLKIYMKMLLSPKIRFGR